MTSLLKQAARPIEVNGAQFLTRCTRPRGLPIIHFLHGNGFSGLTYAPFLAQLEPHFDLVVQELPWHGGSDPLADYPGWNRFAKHALTVLNHLRPDWPNVPVIGLGHSFGGVMTVLMADLEPRLFSVLSLLDPVIFPPAMLAMMKVTKPIGLLARISPGRQAARRRAQWRDRDEALAYFNGRGTFKNWQAEALTSYVDYALKAGDDGRMTLHCPAWLEAAIFNDYPRKMWPAVKKLTQPTQILYGETTYPFLLPSFRKLRRFGDPFEIRQLAGGHCFMQENPTSSAQWVIQFLKNALAKRSADKTS